tara:strand:- start:3241 stop:3351 length:111 start_codon:yes stop_codon:yes gene_type:complete
MPCATGLEAYARKNFRYQASKDLSKREIIKALIASL